MPQSPQSHERNLRLFNGLKVAGYLSPYQSLCDVTEFVDGVM